MTEGCAAKRGSLSASSTMKASSCLITSPTERRVAQRFGQGQALTGFEPLPVAVDETHRHDRHAKQALGEACDAVEGFFGEACRARRIGAMRQPAPARSRRRRRHSSSTLLRSLLSSLSVAPWERCDCCNRRASLRYSMHFLCIRSLVRWRNALRFVNRKEQRLHLSPGDAPAARPPRALRLALRPVPS